MFTNQINCQASCRNKATHICKTNQCNFAGCKDHSLTHQKMCHVTSSLSKLSDQILQRLPFQLQQILKTTCQTIRLYRKQTDKLINHFINQRRRQILSNKMLWNNQINNNQKEQIFDLFITGKIKAVEILQGVRVKLNDPIKQEKLIQQSKGGHQCFKQASLAKQLQSYLFKINELISSQKSEQVFQTLALKKYKQAKKQIWIEDKEKLIYKHQNIQIYLDNLELFTNHNNLSIKLTIHSKPLQILYKSMLIIISRNQLLKININNFKVIEHQRFQGYRGVLLSGQVIVLQLKGQNSKLKIQKMCSNSTKIYLYAGNYIYEYCPQKKQLSCMFKFQHQNQIKSFEVYRENNLVITVGDQIRLFKIGEREERGVQVQGAVGVWEGELVKRKGGVQRIENIFQKLS